MKTWDTNVRFWYEGNDGKRIKFKTKSERDAFMGIGEEVETEEVVTMEYEREEIEWPSK